LYCACRAIGNFNSLNRKTEEDGFSLNFHRPTCTGMGSVGSMIMHIKGIE